MPIEQDLAKAYLDERNTVRAFFEPAADLLLHTAYKTEGIEAFFREYFAFAGTSPASYGELDKPRCDQFPGPWPLPATCVQLRGSRGTVKSVAGHVTGAAPTATPVVLRRLFVGDVAWLFYFEQMGIFQIVKAMLDDFEHSGKTPFARDDATAVILEAMVRERRCFLGSRPIDRDTVYRGQLGWTTKTKSIATVNGAVADHLDRLVVLVMGYYRERRLPDAIRALASTGGGGGGSLPITATLVEIKESIRVLRSAMATFTYGRAHTNTLSGIVWVIASLGLIHDLRAVVGVPSTYGALEQYLPAAYDLLVGKEAVTPTRKNRFLLYRSLAEHARAILMDIEVLDDLKESTDTVRLWLDLVEDEFQAYAAAYRDLNSVDLTTGGKHVQRA